MAELTTTELLDHWFNNAEKGCLDWVYIAKELRKRLKKAEANLEMTRVCSPNNIFHARQNESRAQDKLESLEYRHAALIEIYSDETCMSIESVEKRIDVFINEEQSRG